MSSSALARIPSSMVAIYPAALQFAPPAGSALPPVAASPIAATEQPSPVLPTPALPTVEEFEAMDRAMQQARAKESTDDQKQWLENELRRHGLESIGVAEEEKDEFKRRKQQYHYDRFGGKFVHSPVVHYWKIWIQEEAR